MAEPQSSQAPVIIGVDGCPAGWLAVFYPPGEVSAVKYAVYPDFATLLAAHPAFAALAIDMPIGLPERIIGPGRAAEQAARAKLGPRRASIFSIPARAAVMAESYAEACEIALQTSDPPRKISKQGYNIFPKIRMVDAVLRENPSLVPRVIETHPELIFATLKGEPLLHGKKTPEGRKERQALLLKAGFSPAFLESPAPKGAAPDDLIDAMACAFVAARHAEGRARPYPEPPLLDAFGLPMAIRV